jgi:hypothetical protein
LVCAIEDQSAAIQWYNGSLISTGATGTAIGTGSANTTTIIADQGATETAYAAGLARAYRGGGYTDWFLPSKDELNLMYLNIGQGNALGLGNVGNFFTNYYWSSTEYDNDTVWRSNFSSGVQNGNIKNFTHYVRAVRAF